MPRLKTTALISSKQLVERVYLYINLQYYHYLWTKCAKILKGWAGDTGNGRAYV